MDKIDQRLLQELDVNPKIPLSRLAKRLRISQQVADYRMKRFIDSGIITKMPAIVNLKSLGLEHYRIFFKFHAKKHSNTEIFTYLRNKKGIYWSARIGGEYDLLVVLFVKDFQEFDKFLEDFNHKFPGLIRDYTSSYAVDYYIYRHKYLSKNYSCINYGYSDKIMEIDDVDKQILERLKDNCRLSSLEIGNQIGVSYKTVINRVKTMEKKRIILGNRLFLSHDEKKPFVVLFSFKDYSTKEEKNLISYLSRIDNITQTVRLFGVWNLFVHVRADNHEKLQDLIIELRDKFEIIDSYEIIPVFEDISINLFPV